MSDMYLNQTKAKNISLAWVERPHSQLLFVFVFIL